MRRRRRFFNSIGTENFPPNEYGGPYRDRNPNWADEERERQAAQDRYDVMTDFGGAEDQADMASDVMWEEHHNLLRAQQRLRENRGRRYADLNWYEARYEGTLGRRRPEYDNTQPPERVMEDMQFEDFAEGIDENIDTYNLN